MAHQRIWELAALFIISLFLFSYGLGSAEIIGFESRFFLFAKEMWQTGISWFPTTYFKPYPDYPATSTILIYLSAFLFGLNKLAAVIPTALAAAITVVFTYLIGSLQSKRWGFYAVCFLFLTVTFLKSARSITLDMYPAMFAAMSFYLVYAADTKKQHASVWLIFPLMIFSFAFRGPIGLVIPTGVVCVYYLLTRNYKKFITTGCIALFLLIICTALLLMLARQVGGESFMHDVLRMEVLGRIEGSHLPFYFYFIDAITKYAISYPLACLVLLGVIYSKFVTKKDLPKIGFLFVLFGWMFVILLGMSIPGDKKIRYILPMVPAAALIAAYPFVNEVRQKYFHYLVLVMNKIFLFLPAILLIGLEIIYYYTHRHDMDLMIPYLAVVVLLFIAQIASLLIYYRFFKQSAIRESYVLLIAALVFAAVQIHVIEPIEQFVDRGRDFVVAMENLRMKDHAQLVFYQEKSDGMPIKYVVNMPIEEQPVFIDTQQELEAYKKPAFFITKVSHFEALPKDVAQQFTIIGNDSLGHIRVVVFKRK